MNIGCLKRVFYHADSCADIWDLDIRRSGMYEVTIDGAAVPVNCDLDDLAIGTNDGGWNVIQRRVDDSVNFDRYIMSDNFISMFLTGNSIKY